MNFINPIAVAIVHQDAFARACIAAALASHPDLVVRNDIQIDDLASTGGADAFDGVVVADFASGLRLASTAPVGAGRRPASRPIVVISDTDREWELRCALSRQVRGFLAPGFELGQLAESVRAVQRGARYLCPRAAARLAESMSFESLTEREREVLTLVVDGLCNKSISKALDISNGTVKSHLKSTYAKLNVISRTQAIAVADRRGLLERRAAANVRHDAPQRSMSTPMPASLHAPRLAHESNRAVAH